MPTSFKGASLRLDGPIVSDYECDWYGGISPAKLRGWLEDIEGDVTLWINSPGGNVLAASQMYVALKEHSGHVRVVIEALAASAASVVAMAGDEVLIAPTGYLMIHRAWAMAIGNEADMEQEARALREVDAGILQAYKLKTGMNEDRLLDLMKDETWLNSKTALEYGFVDRVLYADEEEDPEASAAGALQNLMRMPTMGVAYASIRERPKMAAPPAAPSPPPTTEKVPTTATDREKAAFALQMQMARAAL